MRLVRLAGSSRPAARASAGLSARPTRDLVGPVRCGAFRAHLYVGRVTARTGRGPLRACRPELPALGEIFNEEFADLYRQGELEFDNGAMSLLQSWQWPGNVRELRTVVERLHVLYSGERITASHLQSVAGQSAAYSTLRGPKSLDEARMEAVNEALATHGSIARAATALGVHRSTVYRWLSRRPLSA